MPRSGDSKLWWYLSSTGRSDRSRTCTILSAHGGAVGVFFRSVREQFDTLTAMGRLLLNLLASIAEFELAMIRERVVAGMERARKQGKRIGRPRLSDQRGFEDRFARILPAVLSGEKRGGLVCLNSAARFDKWNRAAVR